MTPDDAYEIPTDEIAQNTEATSNDHCEDVSEELDAEVIEARQAFDQDDPADEAETDAGTADDTDDDNDGQAEMVSDDAGPMGEEADPVEAATSVEAVSDHDSPELVELATPFVGQWNQLISTTNWEKGRIIGDWRAALIASGVGAQQYSDEAWARRVGGVTAPHVGRLRRVHERFADSFESYQGLYWSHFLAALDWEDSPLWLEGAVQSGWSVSQMREQRWQAHGAVDSQRPTASQIVEVDLDEDVIDTGTSPAQGGTREYGDEPATSAGKTYEDADFGDEEEYQSLAGPNDGGAAGITSTAENNDVPSAVQPFANLPELPDDLADAVEMMKLAILRHKSNKWEKIDIEVVSKYLEAIGVLMRSP
jgi:hypothetical protein